MCNASGKKLLSFIDEFGLEIKNGRTERDWEGKITYRGEKGKPGVSVIDLVIEKGNLIKKLEVIKRIPVTSQ